MRPSLTDPRAKLDRAAEHLEALSNELSRFSERDPYRIVPDPGLDEGRKVLRFRVDAEPPIKLSLIFGDFIHNLRSALDNLVCQLAYLDGATSCKTTQFPICDSPERFAKGRDRWLAGLNEKHIADIERLQPYEGRDTALVRSLRAVRDFDNIDKHQAIHAAFAALDPRPQTLRGKRNRTDSAVALAIYPVTIGKPLYDGAVLARVEVIGAEGNLGPDMGMQIDLPVGIGFGEIGLRSTVLEIIHSTIKGVIEAFALSFSDATHRNPQDR